MSDIEKLTQYWADMYGEPETTALNGPGKCEFCGLRLVQFDPERRALCLVCDLQVAVMMYGPDAVMGAELTAQGLRQASTAKGEAGWWVSTSQGKVWATDLPVEEPTGTICPDCNRGMLVADGCTKSTIMIRRTRYLRLKYASEQRALFGREDDGTVKAGKRCHDCGAKTGHYHHLGCDVEECPHCHNQLISCGCWRDNPAIDGVEV